MNNITDPAEYIIEHCQHKLEINNRDIRKIPHNSLLVTGRGFFRRHPREQHMKLRRIFQHAQWKNHPEIGLYPVPVNIS